MSEKYDLPGIFASNVFDDATMKRRLPKIAMGALRRARRLAAMLRPGARRLTDPPGPAPRAGE